MNYYEKIIQEKRNSAESHLKGLIGKKFKRDTDLERAVNGSIYTEISDWSHPRMVVFDKYTDEKYILTTEDNNQYGKDQEFWISKVQKANAKEEKDNASVQDRFRHKGCMITILKKGENQYTFTIEKDGREEGTNATYPTQDKAESEAKREVEVNWNEKGEKKNDRLAQRFARNGCYVEIYQTPSGRYRYKVTKDGKTKETVASVSDTFIDVILDAEATADKFNEKEEKDNENFHYLGKTFSVTSGNFQQVRQQVQKAYWDKVKELEVKLRSAEGSEKQRIEKELREIREGYKETLEEFDRFNNEKEEGYYAKLAKEKKNAKMVSFAGKTFRIEDDGSMAQSEYDKLRDRYFDEQDRIKEERSKLQREMDKLARDFNEVKNKIKNLGSIY